MFAYKKRRLPTFILACAILLTSWFIRSTLAEEPDGQAQPDSASCPRTEHSKKTEEAQAKAATAAPKSPAFDPAVVSAGMAAFAQSCTKCHEAARSLERTKDLAGWRATVRRMAARRGAEVASGDIEPIAVYLTSRNTPASAGAPGDKDKTGAPGALSPRQLWIISSPRPFLSNRGRCPPIAPWWRGGSWRRIRRSASLPSGCNIYG